MRKSCIPNVFTFINLSCGIISILSVMNEKYAISGAFILLAGLVDRYDAVSYTHLWWREGGV